MSSAVLKDIEENNWKCMIEIFVFRTQSNQRMILRVTFVIDYEKDTTSLIHHHENLSFFSDASPYPVRIDKYVYSALFPSFLFFIFLNSDWLPLTTVT